MINIYMRYSVRIGSEAMEGVIKLARQVSRYTLRLESMTDL